ncbi:acyl carrier protein [Methyloversatilis discipulorum]|uniref:acyl carrier protein n=1 Tax=Methyloversatilis discipulorum TaxID=1119528 RepID=UPI000370683A|nr:phosphopantetheine-binding protein [Methyloversatilis discipulorum]
MNTALGISVLALTVGVWFFFEKRRVDTQFENTFRGRESLSDDDFYAAFYQDSGISREVVTGVRQVLADELQVDVSRMIPGDDFSRNLRFLLESDSMVDVTLVEALEKRFRIVISDKEAEDTKTVHDVITFVHRKTLST